MNRRIEMAMAELKIPNKDSYTLGEMNKIAVRANCDLLNVMHYLRYVIANNTKTDINAEDVQMVDKIAEEIEARGAWGGHASVYEYMEEYFHPLVEIMKKLGVPYGELAIAHGDVGIAETEYEYNKNSTLERHHIETLNEVYMDEITKSIKEIILRFDSEYWLDPALKELADR